MTLDDLSSAIRRRPRQPRAAAHSRRRQQGFYGGMLAGEVLDVAGYRGIVAYEPTELYITARCGTPLAEIEAALAEKGQMLAFEPPQFSAARRSAAASPPAGRAAPAAGGGGARFRARRQAGRRHGPGARFRRPGHEERRRLRCLAPARRQPRDARRARRGDAEGAAHAGRRTDAGFSLDEGEAVARLNEWGGQPLADFGLVLARRPALAAPVRCARRRRAQRREAGLATCAAVDAEKHWISVREQTHPAFAGEPLWRLALPSTAPAGARWPARHRVGRRPALVRRRAGGGARRGGPPWRPCRALPRAGVAALPEGAFAPLAPAMLALHRRSRRPSTRAASSTPAASTRILMDTRNSPISSATPRRQGSRGDPAQVRALRFLHRHLPDLPVARRRTRRPARPHLPDQAGARGQAGDRKDAPAPRPLPDLPLLRNDLPVGRQVQPSARHRPPGRRGQAAAPAAAMR
jgi:glycolate oxidase FAD binding subunit